MNLCILGKVVLKEYNIEDEAGDAGIALSKTFIATVTHHSLRITLFNILSLKHTEKEQNVFHDI